MNCKVEKRTKVTKCYLQTIYILNQKFTKVLNKNLSLSALFLKYSQLLSFANVFELNVTTNLLIFRSKNISLQH